MWHLQALPVSLSRAGLWVGSLGWCPKMTRAVASTSDQTGLALEAPPPPRLEACGKAVGEPAVTWQWAFHSRQSKDLLLLNQCSRKMPLFSLQMAWLAWRSSAAWRWAWPGWPASSAWPSPSQSPNGPVVFGWQPRAQLCREVAGQ